MRTFTWSFLVSPPSFSLWWEGPERFVFSDDLVPVYAGAGCPRKGCNLDDAAGAVGYSSFLSEADVADDLPSSGIDVPLFNILGTLLRWPCFVAPWRVQILLIQNGDGNACFTTDCSLS
jgi:hypothetical protein